MKKIILGSIVASSFLFGVNTAEININSNTLEVAADYSMNEIYEVNDDSDYFLTLRYLSSEEKFANTKLKQKLITTGLKIMNPYTNDYGIQLGLGIKGVIADNHTKNFMAFPLGIYSTYQINDDVKIDAHLAYAPKILTFADGDTYNELKIKGNYKVIDNGYVYLGTRTIETKYKNLGSTLKYDDSVFFGYQINF